MLTQCPGCQTVFRVTGTILRAAHGQVRCGRCNVQFDAITQLLDEEEVIEPEASSTGTEVDFTPAGISHEDIVLEGRRIEISGIYRRDPTLTDPEPEAHTQTIIEEFTADADPWPGASEALNSESEQLSQQAMPTDYTIDFDVGPASDTELDLADGEQHRDHNLHKHDLHKHAASTSRTQADTLGPITASRDELDDPEQRLIQSSLDQAIAGLDKPAATPTLDDLFTPPAKPRRWPWALASGLCVLLLAAQALHHYREALARHASFGAHLTALYARIGQPLTPPWQVSAYTIQQWGVMADPQQPGTLRVRASVTNNASFAQPYPLLRLSFEDRFGAQVGQRDFLPAEYLSNAAQAERLLEAGRAASIDLSIVDPGQNAEGFQFDTCLTMPQGLVCSH